MKQSDISEIKIKTKMKFHNRNQFLRKSNPIAVSQRDFQPTNPRLIKLGNSHEVKEQQ